MSYIENKELEHRAEGMAGEITGTVPASSVSAVLRKSVKKIDAFAVSCGLWAEKYNLLPPEFEWLLDNRYLISKEISASARELKKSEKLPAGVRGAEVFSLAKAFTESGNGIITTERLELFLRGVQKKRVLLEKELWLFVPMLRGALGLMAVSVCEEMEGVLSGYKRDPRKDPFAAELAVYISQNGGIRAPDGALELSKGAHAVHERLQGLMGNIVTSLRMLSSVDLAPCLQNASAMEGILRNDPIYPLMDDISREDYRKRIVRLSLKEKISETEAATKVLNSPAGDFTMTREALYPPCKTAGFYFVLLFFITGALCAAGGFLSKALWIGLIMLPAALEISKNLCDRLAVKLFPPRAIPRLELKEGIPEEGKTICVISALLTDTRSISELSKKLEYYMLSNRDSGKNLLFGILGDLPDASSKRLSGDKRILEEAQKQIFELNRRYGGGFYLFLRQRELCVRDGRYMGWERKRGALLELMRLLNGLSSGLSAATGDVEALRGVKYVITLDSDTELLPGAARKLVGGMLHPLNKAKIDTEKNIVTEGYGIILPRMTVSLEASGKSLFSRIMAGQGGLDPYEGASGEVYHDLFDQGSFVGKGIIDIKAAIAVLDGRFPENRVLSHDLLEGAYLRAGFMGSLELCDGYPHKAISWFDRLHRWTRGDWQIASWILPRVPKGEKNPLSGLNRYKIFDNLRRSLDSTSLFALLVLGVTLKGDFWIISSVFALLFCLCNLLLSAGMMAFRAVREGFPKAELYHSTIITGLRGVLAQTLFQIIFLPYHAYTCISAMFTALYRLCISKKKLLSWVTAAQSERFNGKIITLSRKMFPAIILGVLTACFSQNLYGWFLGAIWAFSPLICAAVSKPKAKEKPLPDADRAFLARQGALMWRYFEDFLTEEDNFLPPDNWQEQPGAGIAHRTSPTNIGLALICALSARDMRLCTEERVFQIIENILSVLEKLPKWKGHIYNWYDTRSLAPLRPVCVSTVDSGNLAGYLIALKEGLLEIDTEEAKALSVRAGALAEAMDFRALYDEEKKLFAICYDLEQNKRTDGYYDLLASEARLTAYLAAARGETSRDSWRKLSRTLTEEGGYRGLNSWTGTMFEYFMPHLTLPVYENSLLYESLEFSLWCQIKRGKSQKSPWGISESCFWAFDAALNYQYKAHGVPALAYKRSMGKENVISPYSSFLALMLDPVKAVMNLRKMREMGFEGKYGMYEAADFTPSRIAPGKDFELIKCFMSHHLGMSIASVCNILHNNIWQKRFMSDPRMGAYASLLQERVPVGGSVVKPGNREVPEKPKRAEGEHFRREIEEIGPYPRVHPLSNSSYTLLCTDTGIASGFCSGMSVTRFDPYAEDMSGIRLSFTDSGNKRLSLLPENNTGVKYRAVFEGGSVMWETNTPKIRSKVYAFVPDSENAELRVIKIKNLSSAPLKGYIRAYMEPVLQSSDEYNAHPAFSKLFITTQRIYRGVMIERRPRGGEAKYLCVICDSANASFNTSREVTAENGSDGAFGAVLDPCAEINIPISISADSEISLKLCLAVAAAEKDALSSAERAVLTQEPPRAGRMDGLIRTLALTQAEVSGALDMITPLIFDTNQAYLPDGAPIGREGLWKLGISGDLPIILVKARDTAQIERLPRIIRQHRLLSSCGINCDLVILSRDGGDYHRPVRSAVMEALKGINCESLLGARGGVHHADASSLDDLEEALLLAVSRVRPDESKEKPSSPCRYYGDFRKPDTIKPPETKRLQDGAISFDGNSMPLAWSHVLANQAFGALVTERGGCFMWRRNSRENKMIPWQNDPLAYSPPEKISLLINGEEISLFASNDGYPCNVIYGFGYAKWEKILPGGKAVTTMFVPRDRQARVLIAELDGYSKGEINYSSRLCMGINEKETRFIKIKQSTDGLIKAENPYNTAFWPQTFALAASVLPRHISGNTGELKASIGMVRRDGKLRAVLVCGTAQNEGGLNLIRALADDKTANNKLEETVEYWKKLVKPKEFNSGNIAMDNYLNGWALYQIIATRIYARASLYQCGGAYGLRDQLQDVCAAMLTKPHIAKTQLIRACAHQYEEGDGMHWWHSCGSAPDKGVRTRCSDDFLWIPYVLCEYIEKTGDHSIIDIKVPYITSPPLLPDAHDRYETAVRSPLKENLYNHAVRAVDLALHRGVGGHGLCLMGAGDWNDGFNLVGDKGKGESVWLTWFLAHILERMIPLCISQNDNARVDSYKLWREKMIKAGEASWDGEWFKRGYYDDGGTLGSGNDEECRIDSIAQSFSAFFKDDLPEKLSEKAIESAYRHLVDKENSIVKLFTPPFDKTTRNPGYIKGYVPGVRENGGQYTHAAVWLAMGFYKLGEKEKALEILNMLLPETHNPDIYKAEPHVLAADVYSNPNHIGRGGWSHYTGAASWFYRIAREILEN